MDGVNKTLYIPLYGKAYVSRKGIILRDPKAEAIWETEGFPLKGKSASKWLAYYMGIRSAVFDGWTLEKIRENPEASVLHIGCGLDDRVGRVAAEKTMWYDVDFPDVIAQRKRHFTETETYKMLSADAREPEWLDTVTGDSAVVVMEGISMYLKPEELVDLLAALQKRFLKVCILLDCYTEFAAKVSKYKNPINDVGVTEVYGLDDPQALERTGLRFVAEWNMAPEDLISHLKGMEQVIFRKLYAGKMARILYRMYEFDTDSERRRGNAV